MSDWYQRWEAQQAAYVFDREERFTAMLDAVEGTVGPEFVVAYATLADIVAITVYTTDIRQFKEIVAARMEFFKDKLPTSTIVEVNHLADPGLLIEFTAIAAL